MPCRITEVWHKETEVFVFLHDEKNASLSLAKMHEVIVRLANGVLSDEDVRGVGSIVRHCWRRKWFADDGSLLGESESAEMHPYVFKAYPFIDGEVHSFVADLLDQQRCINRLIVMIDHILSCSAKGVLLFPTSQLPSGTKWEDVLDTWAAADGVIPITGRGEMPRQVVTNGGAAGAYQLLNLQMKIFEDISGVGDALMGRADSSVKGAGMYEAQVRNATIALYDLLLSFDAFTKQRNEKMKNC